jgi:hypothetical protein
LPLEEVFIIFVGADPEPIESVALAMCERSVRPADPDAPELARLLQSEGRMKRIMAEHSKLFVGLLLNRHRQRAIELPKLV